MLPVMFAVKTRPNPRTLTASINPVVTVNTRSSAGRGTGFFIAQRSTLVYQVAIEHTTRRPNSLYCGP